MKLALNRLAKFVISILWLNTALIFLMSVTGTLAQAERGPYVVGEPPLPAATRLVELGWLNILDPNEDEYDPQTDGFFTSALLQYTNGVFEVGRMYYDCELIDDGPYGAWSCRYKSYVPGLKYSRCRVLHENAIPDFGPRFSCDDRLP